MRHACLAGRSPEGEDGGMTALALQEEIDVLASLLDVHRLTTVVAGRIDLAPPWRLNSQPTDLLSILVQAAGRSYIVPRGAAGPVVLDAGDILITLRGAGGGYFHDGSNPATANWTLCVPSSPKRTASPVPLRLTKDQPASSLVSCLLRMGDAPRGPLLDSLPAMIHVPAQAAMGHGQFRQVADAIICEATSPGPASTRLMSRLAEILLILVLRQQASERSGHPGLRALSDAYVAPAIKLMHADPGHPWTTASLAAACGLSRSAFAERFAQAVGETPGAYLTGWRMASAAKLLATTDTTVGRVARAVGYRSEAAFRLAFTSAIGCAPREYRLRQREAVCR